jgi:CRISPR-associated protein Cas5h
MKGIIWHLRGEWGSFRPYDTTSIIDTYLFPPKTTIIGMIGAACGWNEDNLVEYYDRIKVGIRIEHFDSVFSDVTKIWKVFLKGSGISRQTKWLYFPENKIYTFKELQKKNLPSPLGVFAVVKRFLYRPEFTIYMATLGEDKLVEDIKSALEDPIYPVTLGDSDSLFYPRNMEYVEMVTEVSPIRSCRFRCLLDAKTVHKAGGIKYTENTGFTIYPRFKMMPIRFEKSRKGLKTKEVVCFKGEIELNEEIEAYGFNGEPVYLF